MFHPETIFRVMDGSILYRIWLPIVFHTSFAAAVVWLYWHYQYSNPLFHLTL